MCVCVARRMWSAWCTDCVMCIGVRRLRRRRWSLTLDGCSVEGLSGWGGVCSCAPSSGYCWRRRRRAATVVARRPPLRTAARCVSPAASSPISGRTTSHSHSQPMPPTARSPLISVICLRCKSELSGHMCVPYAHSFTGWPLKSKQLSRIVIKSYYLAASAATFLINFEWRQKVGHAENI